MPHQTSMAHALLAWYRMAKRPLPWRETRDPYRIWISEIMLQQTRVETVKGYYKRFLQRFPTVSALAAAPEQDVLKAWEGLGYYSRARNLQKAAQVITEEHDGVFPQTYEGLLALPGIGAYTAGAISSISFGLRVPAIDGNVYRVAARYFGIRDDIGSPAVQRQIRALVTDSLPAEGVSDYNQALMELGATVCIPGVPKCGICPWQNTCDAYGEQDAHLLPIRIKKVSPKAMNVAVCLITCQGRILVMRRTQKMLHGLYVFWLLEGDTDRKRVGKTMDDQELRCSFEAVLGTARHVFTHRIWKMELLHYRLLKIPQQAVLDVLGARLVTRPELLTLPLPAAMRAAKEAALELDW